MSKNERHIFIGVLLVLAAALAVMLLQDTLAGRPQEIRRVAVLLDGADESYWQSFRLGVDKAAREHNVDVRYVFRYDGPAGEAQAQQLTARRPVPWCSPARRGRPPCAGTRAWRRASGTGTSSGRR